MVEKKFAVVFGTKVVEDAFHVGRSLERSGSNSNAKVKASRFHLNLLNRGVVDKLHRYKDVKWRCFPVRRGGVRAKKLKRLYSPRLKLLPKQFRTIRSTKQSTDWYSPAPLHTIQQEFDVEWLKWAINTGKWNMLKQTWRCSVLKGLTCLLRNKGSLNPYFFYVLSEYTGNGGIGWPVQEKMIDDTVYYVLQTDITDDDLMPLLIIDFDEWEAMNVEILSPMAVAAGRGSADFDCQILIHPTAAKSTLMEVAAANAFGTMTKSQLVVLADSYWLDTSSSNGLFDVLRVLIKHVLPRLSDLEVVAVIEKRLRHSNEMVEFLKSKDAEGLLDEKDAANLKTFAKKADVEADETEELAKHIGVFKKSASESTAAAAKKKKITGKKGPATMPEDLDGALTDAVVTRMMPENFRVWTDAYNARWQLFQKTDRIRSYAFHRYSHKGAAILAIQKAWEIAVSLGSTPPEWLRSLDADSDVAARSSAAAAVVAA